MAINANPTQNSSQRAVSLQKYLLLHSQQDALQKQIESIFTTYSNSKVSSSPIGHSIPLKRKKSLSTSTPPPNPYNHSHLRSRRNSQPLGSNPSRPSSSLSRLSTSSSSLSDRSGDSEKRQLSSASSTTSPSTSPTSETLTSFPDPSTVQQLSIEQSKLKDVNLEIKSTLMELLNSDNAKSDPRFRSWVQSRLMDVERELRDGRGWSFGFGDI